MRAGVGEAAVDPAGSPRSLRCVAGGVLLLDEPSNQGPGRRDWLVRWIKRTAGTVVLVSHDEHAPGVIAPTAVFVGGQRRHRHNFKGDYISIFTRTRGGSARAAAAAANVRAPSRPEGFIKKFGARGDQGERRQIETKGFGQGERQDGRRRDSVGRLGARSATARVRAKSPLKSDDRQGGEGKAKAKDAPTARRSRLRRPPGPSRLERHSCSSSARAPERARF